MSRLTRQARERRREILRHRIVTDHARHSLALAMYEALADGLAFGPRDQDSSADREWLHGAVAVPLQESVDVALDALVWRISILLDRGPNELGHRFDRSHHEAGPDPD